MVDLNQEIDSIGASIEALKIEHEARRKDLEEHIQRLRHELESSYQQQKQGLHLALLEAKRNRAHNTPLQTLKFTPVEAQTLRDIKPGMVVKCRKFAHVSRQKRVTFVHKNTAIEGVDFRETALFTDDFQCELDETLIDAAFVIIDGKHYGYSNNMNGSDRNIGLRFEVRQIDLNPDTGTATYNPNSELFAYDSNVLNGAAVVCIGHVTNTITEAFLVTQTGA